MSKAEVKVAQRMTSSGMRLIVAATGAACAAVLLAIPQAVFPREGPGLRLDPGAVRAALAEDAIPAPEGELAQRLLSLHADQGRVETSEGESPEEFRERSEALVSALAELHEEGGDAAVDGLRARMLGRLMPALEGELTAEEEEAVLGTFPHMLERYGAMRDGKLVAPQFVIRTLYKARWNGIHHIELTRGFAGIELQAYYGWLALRADSAPLERRMRALDAYEQAGGNTDEARAYMKALAGVGAEASIRYGALWERDGDLRARNHALAIQGVNP